MRDLKKIIKDIEKLSETTQQLTYGIKSNNKVSAYSWINQEECKREIYTIKDLEKFVSKTFYNMDNNNKLYKLRESIKDLEHSLINLFTAVENDKDL